MKLSTREKFLIVLLLVVAVAAVYFYFFWMPMSKQITAVNSKISEQDSAITVAIARKQVHALLQNEVTLHDENWKILDAELPLTFDQSQVINRITHITSAYTDEVTMQFEAVLPDYKGIIVHPVRISLMSSYTDIISMLTSFQTSDKNCRISDIDIREAVGFPDQYTVTFAVQYLEIAPVVEEPQVEEQSQATT